MQFLLRALACRASSGDNSKQCIKMFESWVAAQGISNIVPTSSMHPVKMKALQVLPPTSLAPREDWLSLQKGVWSVISDQVELLTRQEVAPENTKSFYCSQQLLLSDDIVAFSSRHLAGIVPKWASLL